MNRAIARIDGNATSRQAGNRYSQNNRSRVAAQLEAKARAGLVPQDPHAQHLARRASAAGYTSISERAVPVPRVGVGTRGLSLPPVAFIPHRRTREEIAAAHAHYERPLAPRGPPMRSNEDRKEELALRNQFFGKLPEQVLEEGRAKGRTAEREERREGAHGVEGKSVDELRNAIEDEVAEVRAPPFCSWRCS